MSGLVSVKQTIHAKVQANTCARDIGLQYSTVTFVLACHNALMIYECNSVSSNTFHSTAAFPELCRTNWGFSVLIPVRLQLKRVTQRAGEVQLRWFCAQPICRCVLPRGRGRFVEIGQPVLRHFICFTVLQSRLQWNQVVNVLNC
jgi:hypothetical protein